MANETRILVAEDDVSTHEEWSESLSAWGFRVETAEDGERATELIKTFQPHILLTDLRMPRKDGLQLLRDIREMGIDLPTVIISGQGDIPDAVEAIKLGAIDYLRKPVDPPHLRQMLKNLADIVQMREENLTLRRRLADVGELGPLFGRSLVMRRVITAIERLAQSSASVVITGESGTGKELVARTIHETSPRRSAPYVPVNCAAIPETLMESELFGHERGSFTGADRRKEGCFEAANGGTLLLDEITEMKVELQAKLLRVIEEQKLRRVGGTTEIPLDVRVLAASNRDIEQAVRDGKLRSDLYYRLNVFTITLPPLRERADDIPQLVQMFISHYAQQNHKDVVGIDSDVMEAFRGHPWPGNVRQLRNVIERALIVCEGRTIRKNDLPEDFRAANSPDGGFVKIRLGASLGEVEKEMIARTLEFTGGNKTRAADVLGVSAKTLYNKLERFSQQQSPQNT
ncbi:MAG: sigma-54 dependent transcriptional regulator, partial [Candidatus Binatus sp.]|uniref:sigma-54-dependent transcriptional regulator n=1 Tax=Candidatus Binatus sp. TaxID=2811406 RepID=UPI00271C227B